MRTEWLKLSLCCFLCRST